MSTRWLLATLHLLALPLGFAAVWIRGGALRERSGALDYRRIFAADSIWGLMGLLWITTGLIRAFGGWEKGATYYLGNHVFWGKMALLVVLLLLEIWPAVTLVRWRVAIRRGAEVDTTVAPRLAAVSRMQAFLVLAMMLAATAVARGYGQPR